MADNYTKATVSPPLPAELFTDEERESLASACGLASEPDGGVLYFYAGEHFSEEGETAEGKYVNCLSVLQEKLRRLPGDDFPAIAIEGAATCSKMRAGEFGGFAFYITRGSVRYYSTRQWLHEQAGALSPADKPSRPSGDMPATPYSVLLLYPDYAGDYGTDTYYAFVDATDPIAAVDAAQREAVAAQSSEINDPTDFQPLLVIEGHHASKPMFNK